MARTYFPHVPPKTASINVRLSKEARDENLSKDGMVADCLAVAETHGLSVVAVHVDDGISGAVRNRPGFIAWLDDAREARVDHLIAWHVDRMTREGVNVAGAILDTIEGKDPETGKQVRHPVRLLDTKGLDSFGDPTAFRFQFVIAAEVARAERERMRDRSRAARRRVLEAGRWPGGPAPFGFQVVDNPDGPGKVIQIDHYEAAFIREAVERVLAGQTLLSVVRWANGSDGMKPRRARDWSRRTLLQVLTGHAVRGQVVKYVGETAVPLVDSDGEPLTAPAILTPDESAAIRAALEIKPDPRRRGGRKPARLLSGLLRCHSCSGRMQVARRTDGSVTYRCQTASLAGSCSQPVSISAPALEAFMSQHFLDRYGSSPELVKRAQVTGAAAVEEAEQAVTDALNALAQAATPENLTLLQEAQADLAVAQELPQEAEVLILPTGRTQAEAWAAGDTDDRRDLLLTNYVEIVVKPGRRGRRGIDPARLDIWTQPPYVVGVSTDWRHGSVAVQA